MVKPEKYDFSFTASSLRLSEMVMVAEAALKKRKIDYVNELGKGKASTGRRMLSEFKKRLAHLTVEQLSALVTGDFVIQKQIAYLSVCKTYGFIRDFVIEVIREKYLIFDNQITDGDFLSFFRRKADLHPEMDTLTEITQKKIKQVTFKILEQSGIIDNVKNKMIQPQLVDDTVVSTILSEHPKWLKVFLMSDRDIINLTQ
jgi:hypothetical protein